MLSYLICISKVVSQLTFFNDVTCYTLTDAATLETSLTSGYRTTLRPSDVTNVGITAGLLHISLLVRHFSIFVTGKNVAEIRCLAKKVYKDAMFTRLV